MLEQRIVTTYTNGRLSWTRSFLHGIGRVNLRWGLDVNIRRGMDIVWSSTFEAKILRLLWINHPNFEKLLEDDSLKLISFDEAKGIRDNTLSRINSLPWNVTEKDIKRGLLRDYMSWLNTSEPIPERPFLYIMSEIFHNGDTTTVLAELKDRAIPSDFNLDTARSQFENPEAADIALENAKADLLKDINTDLPDGDIKDKLIGKAEKFTDIDKLKTFKTDVFEHVRDLLSWVRSIPDETLPTEIKDRITKSIYNALSITALLKETYLNNLKKL